jgi:hypothetical protein
VGDKEELTNLSLLATVAPARCQDGADAALVGVMCDSLTWISQNVVKRARRK